MCIEMPESKYKFRVDLKDDRGFVEADDFDYVKSYGEIISIVIGVISVPISYVKSITNLTV